MQAISYNARKINVNAWIFIFFITISFYSIGAGSVESLVNYPVWHIIGPSDVWVSYHTALGSRIIVVLAIPALLLQLIANTLLFFFRPPVIPKWTVWATLLLLLTSIVSSFLIQIPIQMELDRAYIRVAVDHLINTDLLLRIASGYIRCTIIIYMMISYMRMIK